MMSDFARWAAILEMALLLFCGGYLLHGYRRAIPRLLQVMGHVYGGVLLLTAVALAINIASPRAQTPGVKVFAATVAPLALAAVVGMALALSRRKP